jgi:hypothetical protein
MILSPRLGAIPELPQRCLCPGDQAFKSWEDLSPLPLERRIGFEEDADTRVGIRP